MMTTTFLTFLTSDNFFLHDICSYFLFLKSVLSCLFPVKSKKPNMGGERRLIIKCRGRSQIQILVKWWGDHYKMIFRVKSNSLLQLSTIKHNRVTFWNLIHTFGELRLKILPQKCILYFFKIDNLGKCREHYLPGVTLGRLQMFWGCCGKSYNFETANSLVFQAQIW